MVTQLNLVRKRLLVNLKNPRLRYNVAVHMAGKIIGLLIVLGVMTTFIPRAVHAAGLAEIVDPTLRGGPEVRIYLPGLRQGFVRLFAQVQIDGRVITAPFGIQVEP